VIVWVICWTEKIYYTYIDKTYSSLDIICIVVDIGEAFNTSGSIQILKSYSKWNKNELINKLETYYNSNISMNDA
jgi:hypothetical protein